MDFRLHEWSHVWHFWDHFPVLQNIYQNSKRHFLGFVHEAHSCLCFSPLARKVVSHYHLAKLLLLLYGWTWHRVLKDRKASLYYCVQCYYLAATLFLEAVSRLSQGGQPRNQLSLESIAKKSACSGLDSGLRMWTGCALQLGNLVVLLSFTVHMLTR